MTNTRMCMECGSSFYGRADKKFCSELCRNTHNNRERSVTSNYIRNINTILTKNRRILEQFITTSAGTAKASKNKLLEKGFNFNYFTSLYTTKKGYTYYYCYDYGYLPIEHDYYFLVKRMDT